MSRSKKVATEQLRQLFGPQIEDEDVREAGGGLSVHVPRHYRDQPPIRIGSLADPYFLEEEADK